MNKFEDIECTTLCKTYKLRIEDANFAKGYIPRKILLDGTRNIHSYFVFCKMEDEALLSVYWEKQNFRKALKSMLALQYSDLDRPLFFIFRDNEGKYKAIEGNELRETFLENPHINITEYILENSYKLFDMLLRIKNEL